MRRGLLAFLAAVAFALVLAGCGGPSAAPAPTSTALPPATTGIPVPLQQAAAALQIAYRQGNWPGLRATFADRGVERSLVKQMKGWKSMNVRDLNVTLVDRVSLGPAEYAGTVRFAADPRAVPIYITYIFQQQQGRLRITGTTTGIKETSFRHAAWSVTRSAHFTVYHSPYVFQGPERAELADLEEERQLFMRKFGVKVAAHINYYWYPNQSMMSPMTSHLCGTSPGLVGCANPYNHPPTIHTSEWPSYHEPIHVYELALEPREKPHSRVVQVAPLFISEGTAVALEDKEVDPRLSDYCSDLIWVPLDACAFQAVLSVHPLSILSDKGFKKAVAGDAYAMGGSFVKYLILRYGYHRFGRFYYVLAAQPGDGTRDYNVATRRVYGQTIQELLHAWNLQLCRPQC